MEEKRLTLQTRLIFKQDKKYTNESDIILPLLTVINIQKQPNILKYLENDDKLIRRVHSNAKERERERERGGAETEEEIIRHSRTHIAVTKKQANLRECCGNFVQLRTTGRSWLDCNGTSIFLQAHWRRRKMKKIDVTSHEKL